MSFSIPLYPSKSTGAQGAQGAQGATGPQGSGGTIGYWGSFWSTQNQINENTPPTTIKAMTLNNTDPNSFGIRITNNSRITFDYSGVYNIQFSAQIDDTNQPAKQVIDIWFALNGNPISDSNTKVNVDNQNSYLVASWNYMIKLNAGDYIEIYWYSTDTGIRLAYSPATVGPPSLPAIPSVIVTAQQVTNTQIGFGVSGTNWGQSINWNNSSNTWQITGNGPLAFGNNAGLTNQQTNAIALGTSAGTTNQGTNAIAIGAYAGQSNQGTNAIAIGAYAGYTSQNQNSIIINATGTYLNSATQNATYIAPIRGTPGATPVLVYNTINNEITYDTSSIKYKKNIIDLTEDTTKLYDIRPREYDAISDNKHYIGFIAEELNEINNLFTWKNSDGTPEGVEWFNILVFCVNEMKKMRQEINDLKNIVSNNA